MFIDFSYTMFAQNLWVHESGRLFLSSLKAFKKCHIAYIALICSFAFGDLKSTTSFTFLVA